MLQIGAKILFIYLQFLVIVLISHDCYNKLPQTVT